MQEQRETATDVELSTPQAKDAEIRVSAGAVADSDDHVVKVIASKWNNLSDVMNSDEELANTMVHVPSETMVKIFWETKKQDRLNINVKNDSLSRCTQKEEELRCSPSEQTINSDDSVPDALESPSVKSCSEEEEDDFDVAGGPMPSISSSTTPIVLEVAPRNGRLASKDPLFQGVCLYSGSMSQSQVEAYASKQAIPEEAPSGTSRRQSSSAWFLPSVFQYFLNKPRQSATAV